MIVGLHDQIYIRIYIYMYTFIIPTKHVQRTLRSYEKSPGKWWIIHGFSSVIGTEMHGSDCHMNIWLGLLQSRPVNLGGLNDTRGLTKGGPNSYTLEGNCGDVWCWYKITRSNTWVDVFGVLIMFLVLISKAAFCIKKHIPFIRPSSSSSDPLTLNLKPTRQPVRYCALVRLSLASGRRFGMVGHSSSNWNLGPNLGELNTQKAKLHVLWHPSSFWNQSLGILWNMNI